MKNKLLVISDIHSRPFWKKAVEKYIDDVDKIIFLGDYLDRYEDEGFTRKEEKQNFLEIIEFKKENKDKVILLLGNHDGHYIERSFARSRRYSSSHAYSYRQIFLENKGLFQLAYEHELGGKKYLFTHAGVMRSWYERNKETIGDLTIENLNRLFDSKSGIMALSDVSSYRSHFGEKSGSFLWSDVNEKVNFDMMRENEEKFEPNEDSCVDEYDYQIFGHTQLSLHPIITDKWACLDVRQAFILNEDGSLDVIETEKKS